MIRARRGVERARVGHVAYSRTLAQEAIGPYSFYSIHSLVSSAVSLSRLSKQLRFECDTYCSNNA